MSRKQYKVKFDHGVITPLEPIDLDEGKEGVIIFYEDDDKDPLEEKQIPSEITAILSENSLSRVWDNEEDDVYNRV